MRAFAHYGAVHSVARAHALDFGVVRFLQHGSAVAAIAGLNGAHLRERAITVKWGSAAPPAATVTAAPAAPLGQAPNPAHTPWLGFLGMPQMPPSRPPPGVPRGATAAASAANGSSGLGFGWAQALGLGVQAAGPQPAARPAHLPPNGALRHPVAPMPPSPLSYLANGSAAHPGTAFPGAPVWGRPPASAPANAPAPAPPQANGWVPSYLTLAASGAAAAPAAVQAGGWEALAVPPVTAALPLPGWALQGRAHALAPGGAPADPAPQSPMGGALGGSGLLEWCPLPGQPQARQPAAGEAGAAGKASVPGFSLFARAGPLEGLMHRAGAQGPGMPAEFGPQGAFGFPQQDALRARMSFCGMDALSSSAHPKT